MDTFAALVQAAAYRIGYVPEVVAKDRGRTGIGGRDNGIVDCAELRALLSLVAVLVVQEACTTLYAGYALLKIPWLKVLGDCNHQFRGAFFLHMHTCYWNACVRSWFSFGSADESAGVETAGCIVAQTRDGAWKQGPDGVRRRIGILGPMRSRRLGQWLSYHRDFTINDQK